jgi:hypothetical protein
MQEMTEAPVSIHPVEWAGAGVCRIPTLTSTEGLGKAVVLAFTNSKRILGLFSRFDGVIELRMNLRVISNWSGQELDQKCDDC